MNHLSKYYSQKYLNFNILFQMADNAKITGANIENILTNESDFEWLEGVKKWYNMNKNRNLSMEQVFHTIFMCIEDLKKGEETFSKQPLNRGSYDDLYEVPKTAQYILTKMLITPQYRFVSRSNLY
tara:strand:- start:704 stop:1081 length:378 start_codon:yes stop_codon:yes gene_type:complete